MTKQEKGRVRKTLALFVALGGLIGLLFGCGSDTNAVSSDTTEQAGVFSSVAENSSQAQSEEVSEKDAQNTVKKDFPYPYGVFLGMNGEQVEDITAYEIVVIETTEFSEKEMQTLKQNGQQIYGYLNVGCVEKFREYYDSFESITLETYEDWPHERWVDVSQAKWQDYLVNTLAKSMAQQGIDGFFLDNFDVWYEYPDAKIYDGLLQILKGLKQYGLKIIINGGDTFVTKAIETGEYHGLIDGVNQETVFTSINFDNHTFGTQDAENNEYYTEYLQQCKQAKLLVYLLEYGASKKNIEAIQAYCRENQFAYYNARTLNLDSAS